MMTMRGLQHHLRVRKNSLMTMELHISGIEILKFGYLRLVPEIHNML